MTILTTPMFFGHHEAVLASVKTFAEVLQLTAGPAAMVLFVALQNLKKQLTGTHSSKLYENIWKWISKAEARDKLGRILQYYCRHLLGVIDRLPKEHALQAWKKAIVDTQSTVTWARRTHRWGKELPLIPKLGKAWDANDWLEFAQNMSQALFIVQDHVTWLLHVGLLKFEYYNATQWGKRNLRFQTWAHILAFAVAARSLKRISEKEAKNDPEFTGSEKAVQKASDAKWEAYKALFCQFLLTCQRLHCADILKMDNWYIGIFGVITASLDAAKQWPS